MDIPCALAWQDLLPNAPPLATGGGVLLSIDLDVLVSVRGLPEGSLIRQFALCPESEESWTAKQTMANWEQIAALLAPHGLPQEVMGAPEGALGALRAVLDRRTRRPRRCWIADSHSWGAWAVCEVARCAGGPVDVISLDQHHDLGYEPDDPIAAAASCENWLGGAIIHGLVRQATLIHATPYGDMRSFPPTLSAELMRRHVTDMTLDQWGAIPGRIDVDGLLLVRSSGWTPPWGGHDQMFLDLARLLAAEVICLDCHPPTGVRIGAHDACRPRPEITDG